MILSSRMYVPTLYWRQAEYQALSNLTEAEKRLLLAPCITIYEGQKTRIGYAEGYSPFPRNIIKNGAIFPHGLGFTQTSSKYR